MIGAIREIGKLLKDEEYVKLVYQFTTAPEFLRQRIDMAIERLFR